MMGGLRSKHVDEFNLRTPVLAVAQGGHLQRVKIPEAAYVQFARRPPDNERIAHETCRKI
jgi:hypothetical protein